MLKIERNNDVLLLLLDRPEKRNALHPDLIRELSQALTGADQNATIGAVVLTGAGTTFCAGLALDHLLSLDADGRISYVQSVFTIYRQILHLSQPVIAAANGPAIAGGFDLAAVCDLRLCSPEARFAEPEVLLGLTQLMYPLYKIIGWSRAKELALTGEAISAEEAYRIGLVNHIYPAEQLLEQAMKLAGTIASRPRQALFETKRLSREVIDMDMESAFRRMFAALDERLRSEEHHREVERYTTRLKQRK